MRWTPGPEQPLLNYINKAKYNESRRVEINRLQFREAIGYRYQPKFLSYTWRTWCEFLIMPVILQKDGPAFWKWEGKWMLSRWRIILCLFAQMGYNLSPKRVVFVQIVCKNSSSIHLGGARGWSLHTLCFSELRCQSLSISLFLSLFLSNRFLSSVSYYKLQVVKGNCIVKSQYSPRCVCSLQLIVGK